MHYICITMNLIKNLISCHIVVQKVLVRSSNRQSVIVGLQYGPRKERLTILCIIDTIVDKQHGACYKEKAQTHLKHRHTAVGILCHVARGAFLWVNNTIKRAIIHKTGGPFLEVRAVDGKLKSRLEWPTLVIYTTSCVSSYQPCEELSPFV